MLRLLHLEKQCEAADEAVRLRFSLVLNPALDMFGYNGTSYLFRERCLADVRVCVVRLR
jgi:hypothetical protein